MPRSSVLRHVVARSSVVATRGKLAAVALVATLATACAGPGAYVWFSDVPHEAGGPSADYIVKPGDTLNVRLLGHEDMSGRQLVRSDGKIGLPLIGEVEVQGKRPSAIRAELETRLKEYIVSPSVSVNVDESRPITVRVIGEVAKPGSFAVPGNADIVEAMALSGGLTDYASRDRIFLVREQPPARIRFTYDALSRNENGAASFPLHSGDLIVVE